MEKIKLSWLYECFKNVDDKNRISLMLVGAGIDLSAWVECKILNYANWGFFDIYLGYSEKGFILRLKNTKDNPEPNYFLTSFLEFQTRMDSAHPWWKLLDCWEMKTTKNDARSDVMIEDKVLIKGAKFKFETKESDWGCKELKLGETGIEGVFVNEEKGLVTVKFNNGNIRHSLCSKNDPFDVSVGVANCIAAEWFGTKTHFKKWVKDNAKFIKKKAKKKKEEETKPDSENDAE